MKLNKSLVSFLFCLLIVNGFLFSQVSGVILDQNGLPLPYATVLLKDTGTGVSANEEGRFELPDLRPGQYTLQVSFVGYSSHTEKIDYTGAKLDLSIKLKASSMLVEEFVVLSSGEDPAYAIIRAAQEKRTYYLKGLPAYTCDVYVKGLFRLDSVPSSLFGISLEMDEEEMDEREKILYLSETKSKLYSDGGDDFKEVITASVVSGNDQGYSFNSAAELDINLYKNTIDLGRPIVSPIASNAMTYYRYRLLRTYTEENGEKIHEIKLLPKRPSDAAYAGRIFIVDGKWSIYSSDLFISGKAAYTEGLDSLKIRQQYINLGNKEHSFVVSRQISLYGGVMGLLFSGTFTGVYDGYKFKGEIEPPLGKKEVLAFTEESTERSKVYFDSIRPIPLSEVEKVDYEFKDSLQQLTKDPVHLDSMEAKSNRFKYMDLLMGYTWNKRSKNIRLRVSSPLTSVLFNPVQGRNVNLRVAFSKFKDAKRLQNFFASTRLTYGFSEKIIRPQLELGYNFNKITNDRLSIFGGIELKDFNDTESISLLLNSTYCLYNHENPLRLYEKRNLGLSFRRNISHFLDLRLAMEWANRRSVVNTSEYSYLKKEGLYQANLPSQVLGAFENTVYNLSLDTRFFIGRTYRSYPDRRVYNGSSWPVLKFSYDMFYYDTGDLAHRFSFGVVDNSVSLGAYGKSSYNINLGFAINGERLHYLDYMHFAGNSTIINSSKQLTEGFSLLPYYDYSTYDLHLRGRWSHDFNGFILSKLPLLKRLGFSTVLSSAALIKKDLSYMEFGVGLDRIGFGLMRVIRLDYVVGGFVGDKFLSQRGLRLSVKL